MSQIDIFGDSHSDINNIIKPGFNPVRDGEVIFLPSFFLKMESDSFFKKLRENIEWKQESMKIYGKNILFPRLTAWYGDDKKPYSFSGITLHPVNWTPELMEIKTRIEEIAKCTFNSVLLNLYRDGNDSISWHTDAEKELGNNPTIASVNFGQTRTFQLRHKNTKEKIEIDLAHGSLLVMQEELQHFWQHQIPKVNKPIKERINLTFRVIK